jgi:hypothetical protein
MFVKSLEYNDLINPDTKLCKVFSWQAVYHFASNPVMVLVRVTFQGAKVEALFIFNGYCHIVDQGMRDKYRLAVIIQ